MRVVVAGLGVQGHKRRRVAGADFVAAVDPVNPQAEYRAIEDVPLSSYDAVLACIPDEPKINVLAYLLGNGKHVLVEKPLWAGDEDSIARLEAVARSKGVVCYVAYNHRFEPHFVRMRETVASGKLGALYRCRMFYGNGTARLVREFAMARPGRWRPPRPRLASPRHRAILVWRHRREYPGRIQPLLRESCARSCRARLWQHHPAARAGDDAAQLA